MIIRCLFITILLGLGACATQVESLQTRNQNDACVVVATARAHDADLNGFDADMQKTIYEGAYKDCLKWSDKAVYSDFGSR